MVPISTQQILHEVLLMSIDRMAHNEAAFLRPVICCCSYVDRAVANAFSEFLANLPSLLFAH